MFLQRTLNLMHTYLGLMMKVSQLTKLIWGKSMKTWEVCLPNEISKRVKLYYRYPESWWFRLKMRIRHQLENKLKKRFWTKIWIKLWNLTKILMQLTSFIWNNKVRIHPSITILRCNQKSWVITLCILAMKNINICKVVHLLI